jgi:very-short-patch-repair endonuclease
MTEEESGIPMVLNLLNYIEQVERLKTKPAFSVPEEYFSAYQQELEALPGVEFNLQSDGDDIWLRIHRLKEIDAPAPDEELKFWITLPKSPEKQPELKHEAVVMEGRKEVSRSRIEDNPQIRALFDWYIENQWNPWAVAERPRRKAIARYNKLFTLQQAIASEGAETPVELVWGIGYAAWKKEGFSTSLKHPILTQACEVTLNSRTFDLEVRPRGVDPRVEADCYVEMDVPGIRQVESFWQAAQASGLNRLNPFEPTTYEGVLRAAVGYLDPSGTYEDRNGRMQLPMPTPQLMITSDWVLFARRRSGDIFLQDIRRLKEKLEQMDDLPSVIRSFVQRGDDEIRVRPEQPFRGLSTSDAGAGAMELFFPMPYNDEQVSIVQKLHSNDGVVVQGPPGTGKTHTIANVICHYLALGKRVLVTAKSESALAVLQEKLPEAIRPLSISLLSDERDGMRQFEHAIQTIATRVATINPSRAASAIETAEAKLNQLHAKIAYVDNTVTTYARKHMQSYSFNGREITPEEMAKVVIETSDQHEWFDDDVPVTAESSLPFGDAAISALRQARLAVGQDLNYLEKLLPEPNAIPPWADLRSLHVDLVRARAIDESVSEGSTFGLVDSRLETFTKCQELVAFMEDRRSLLARLEGLSYPWLDAARARLADMQPQDPLLVALMSVVNEVRGLEEQRRDLVAKAVSVPAGAESNDDFQEAINRLIAGRSPFLLPFGRGEARRILEGVSLAGSQPSGTEEWSLVAQVVSWRSEARRAIARWNAMAGEFYLVQADLTPDEGFRSLAQWRSAIEDAHRAVFVYDKGLHPKLRDVLGAAADQLWEGGESFVFEAHQSLKRHVDRSRLAYALKRVQDILEVLEGRSGPIVDRLRDLLRNVVGREGDDEALQSDWTAALSELKRLASIRPYFDEITAVTSQIEAAGAIRWSHRLRTEPATEVDRHTPPTWMDAWNWRRAVIFLDKIDGHSRFRELFSERDALTTSLARTYQELVAEKTWLAVFNNSPDSVRQALQSYLNAVRAMGAGTGVRAIRHRRNAREAMNRAYKAVPCWVLPHWRVSETIPPEIGLFDLVVIDEASQSDIWALPAILRGRTILVVGDHQQVSPSAIGTSEERVKELIRRFLDDQPFGPQMTPEKSIYDLASVVFAGNSVMLKEHFRCVPAIIEFSNREFYQGAIKPLRIPKANERLDPPLVDVYVRGGHRDGDVNQAEARAIVEEIRLILAAPAFGGRSIGVVTLLGTAQAALLHDLINQDISPADITERRIAIGPPPVFQGRERDIMLVSMVIDPRSRAAANRADMHQRFNVALSRARDRMYLFRSITEADVGGDSLNAKVMTHFRQPFRQDGRRVQALRDRCESDFERAMYDELVRRGFRVEPQVSCGAFRIDFVVEGAEGRRLAVECDGDQFHGPGQWQDDMTRQRVLERAGWTFWRCFASSFVRRKEAVLDDLMQTLARLGIEPLGSDSVDSTVWVQSKVVDPFAVASDEPEETV